MDKLEEHREEDK